MIFSHKSAPLGEASRLLTKAQAVTIIKFSLGLPDREAAEKLFEDLYGKEVEEVLPQVLGTSIFFHEGF